MAPFGLTVLRLCVGAVFIAHGAQKLFAVWAGPGLAGTATMLGSLGFPYGYPLAILLALTEFVGGIFLILGGLTRWVALALAIDMGVAIWKVHYRHGFFMNWSAEPGLGHGVEFTLVLLAAVLCLALAGPGALSIDEWRSQSAEAEARGRARMRKV